MATGTLLAQGFNAKSNHVTVTKSSRGEVAGHDHQASIRNQLRGSEPRRKYCNLWSGECADTVVAGLQATRFIAAVFRYHGNLKATAGHSMLCRSGPAPFRVVIQSSPSTSSACGKMTDDTDFRLQAVSAWNNNVRRRPGRRESQVTPRRPGPAPGRDHRFAASQPGRFHPAYSGRRRGCRRD